MSNKINLVTQESAAPRIPNSEDYWDKKGKPGKKVMLYFHDDLDGVFSGVAIKKYLLSKGFTIVGYGVVNYQEGWEIIELDNQYINIAVDFAEITDGIDVYIDHHGDFKEGADLSGKFAVKTPTSSAYEGIMDQIGQPVDSMVLNVIKMVDAAKYDEFGVKWTDLLEWDIDKFKNHKNPKLMFAGVFNQLLKRSDYRTFVEVVHNATDPSIYQIYRLFRLLYPMNNLDWRALKNIRSYDPDSNEQTIWNQFHAGDLDEQLMDKKGNLPEIFKDFMDDGNWRLGQMIQKTSGKADNKEQLSSLSEFVNLYLEEVSYSASSRSKFAGMSAKVIKMDGYAIIGELAFIPSGTWANAIRARSIVEKDIISGRLRGVIKEDIKWVLLQYGDTLQMCSFGDIDEYDKSTLPLTKEGKIIDDLKVYTNGVLDRFKNVLDFKNENTLAGGHTGIGTISNIGISRYQSDGDKMKNLSNIRYLDIFKNYIIANLSQVPWNVGLSWENPFSAERAEEPTPIDAMVMTTNQIRIVDVNKSLEITYPDNYVHKPNMGDLKKKAAELKAELLEKEKIKIEEGVAYAQLEHQFYAQKKPGDNTTFDMWKKKQKENETETI